VSVPKNKLHKLIDALPEAATEAAAKYLESLLNHKTMEKSDLKKALDAAPYDDESLTDEDVHDIQEARKEIELEETVALDEVKRILGL
jgi:hypothetical protein